jgi:predicted outer membrane protein
MKPTLIILLIAASVIAGEQPPPQRTEVEVIDETTNARRSDVLVRIRALDPKPLPSAYMTPVDKKPGFFWTHCIPLGTKTVRVEVTLPPTKSVNIPDGPSLKQIPYSEKIQVKIRSQAIGQKPPRGRVLDRFIVDRVSNDIREQITLARIAEQRAHNPEIKQFAQRMIQDNTNFLNKLQNPDGGASSSGNTASQPTSIRSDDNPVAGLRGQPEQAGANANQNAAGNQAAGQAGESNGNAGRHGRVDYRDGARQFLQLEKQIHAQTLQSKTRELSQKQGAQFDNGYINGQVANLTRLGDALTVYSGHTSDQLQDIVQEELQTIRQHLAMAKQIAERLDEEIPKAAAGPRSP